MAAVAAMVVGCTLRTARKHMKSSTCKVDGKPYYQTREWLKFVGGRGVVAGGIYRGEGSLLIDKDTVLRFDHYMRDVKAVLIVESDTFDGYTHAVFWDGKHVRDPSSSMPAVTKLEDYSVLEVMPLTYLDESSNG